MTRQKLTLVVSCTDRKLGTPEETLMARSLAGESLDRRVSEWKRRINASKRVLPLMDLYKGETWSQAKRLARTAERAGYEYEFLVASAGLGLRRVSDQAPAYAATFARRHPDSVAANNAESVAWWSALGHTANPSPRGPSIWVLSESYAFAMQGVLRMLEPSTALVFGGSATTPPSVRVPSDRNLRPALGGTMTSLNTRMAIRWIEIADGASLTSAAVRKAWATWAHQVAQPETFDRESLPDATIRLLVQDMRRRKPGLTKTSGLRELRAAGFACEQGRFSTLFKEAVEHDNEH